MASVVFVLCHVSSPVYCLSPPILSPHYCFSFSTGVSLVTLLICLPIYSPGVAVLCWSIVLRHVCVMSDCTAVLYLPANLFFPLRVFFVHFCFILLLKRPILPALESSPHYLLPYPDTRWYCCASAKYCRPPMRTHPFRSLRLHCSVSGGIVANNRE